MKILISALAATALGATAAAANTADDWWAAREAQLQELGDSRISAQTLLRADVASAGDTVASVDELVLSPDGMRIQYVMFDVRKPGTPFEVPNGFVSWSNVDVDTAGWDEADIVLVDEAAAGAPDEFTLNRTEANRRMLSNLIGSSMAFADGQVREVSDVLIDPQTGAVLDYVVQFDTQSAFDNDARKVPAEFVRRDANGGMTAVHPLTYDYTIWVL